MRRGARILPFVLGVGLAAHAQTNSGENKPKADPSGATAPAPRAEEQKVALDEEKTSGEGGEDESPFSLYRDTYLLLGYSDSGFTKPLVYKFQLSAKFKMPVPGVYLAYTQRSFMDVLEDSAPFTDHIFEPEVYYVYSFSAAFTKKSGLRSVQAGYRHQSNGRDGPQSRSWERLYAEMEFRRGGWYVRPTAWLPFFVDSTNGDIEDYWGYGELSLAYVWSNDVRLSGLFHAGIDWPRGNVKADLTVPFRLLFATLPAGWKQSNLWLQAFHGHGETFRGYAESSTAVAVGVGFRPDFHRE